MGMMIGPMRHRVTIQAPTITSSAAGNVKTWAAVSTNSDVWCRIKPLSADERFRADKIEMPVTHEVQMRYRSDASTTWRLVYGSRYLYVRSAINTGERGAETILLCEELQ
jgi:SPP1 family predicted phage head-tail adaptor